MKRCECETRSGACQRRRAEGFTLLELIIVMAIMLVATVIFTPNVVRVMQDVTVGNGFDATLMTIRRAHDGAVNERRVYVVTFTAPATVTVAPLNADPTALNLTTVLPQGVAFSAESGIPNTVATTPDHFGTGQSTGAIDFDIGVTGTGTNTIYFYPDGTARDINGNINSGVVYIARSGNLLSSRAITVWGASGRIRGWRLYSTTSGVSWSQQ